MTNIFRLAFGYTNTYVLTKALSEDLVASYETKLPIVVLRPSMVMQTANDPFKGYVEGQGAGLIGCIAGVMTGLLRNVALIGEAPCQTTPVDFVASAIIVSACKRATAESQEMLVFNCTASSDNVLTWEMAVNAMNKHIPSYPLLKKMAWYPQLSITPNYVLHRLWIFLFQLLPCFILDGLLLLFRQKPM